MVSNPFVWTSIRPSHYLLNQWAEIEQSPPNFRPILHTVREQMTVEDFHNGHLGGHIAYRNKMILAILSLYVAQVPPTKVWLSPTYHSGADVVSQGTRNK